MNNTWDKTWLRLLILSLLAGLGFTQMGCDIKFPWDKKVEPAVQTEADSKDDAAGDQKAEAPLDMSKLLPPAMRNLAYSAVSISMTDGLKIVGRLYDPAITKNVDGETVTPADSDTDYAGSKYPLVILLHGLGLSQEHWQSLPATLVKAGYAVYAMDLRGHGLSTKASRGRSINWRQIQDDGWSSVYRDVDQVIEYFGKSEDHPEVNGKQVALVGETLGANVAIWAAKQNEKVKALALFSPGMLIKGLDAGKGIMDYPNSTIILVSEDERDDFETARYLYSWLGGPKVLQVYKKAGDGADMLIGQPAIADQLCDWLVKTVPPPASMSVKASTQEISQEKSPEKSKEKSTKTETPASKG